MFIAVFIGIGLVSKEVERRSIYALLAKPMSRTELVLGKFLGLVSTLAVNVVVMTVALVIVLAVYEALTPEAVRKAWEAPATDPRIAIAAFLMCFVSTLYPAWRAAALNPIEGLRHESFTPNVNGLLYYEGKDTL